MRESSCGCDKHTRTVTHTHNHTHTNAQNMLGDSEFEDFHPYVDFASKNDDNAPPELADAIRHLSQTLDTDQRAIFDAVMTQIHAGDQFFHVVTAGAGAGKSRLLAAITAAAHANGVGVAGLTFMRKSVSVARSRAMMPWRHCRKRASKHTTPQLL